MARTDGPHDAEALAARFLGGDLAPAEHEAFGRHLLECPACAGEVDVARTGRRLAEAARTLPSADLRDRVRALVESQDGPTHPLVPAVRHARLVRRRPALVAAAAAVVALAVGTPLALQARGPADSPAMASAVADFSSARLPGRALPDVVAPDLRALQLETVGAGAGAYDGVPVDAYAYRDPLGRRVVVYLSEEPFPDVADADYLRGQDGAWTVRRGDVTVLCARLPHAMLIVGQDPMLVRSTAEQLRAL